MRSPSSRRSSASSNASVAKRSGAPKTKPIGSGVRKRKRTASAGRTRLWSASATSCSGVLARWWTTPASPLPSCTFRARRRRSANASPLPLLPAPAPDVAAARRIESDVRRRAAAVAMQARRQFIAGDHQGALATLHEFSPQELVAPVIAELETELRRFKRRREETARGIAAVATPVPEAAGSARRRDPSAARRATAAGAIVGRPIVGERARAEAFHLPVEAAGHAQACAARARLHAWLRANLAAWRHRAGRPPALHRSFRLRLLNRPLRLGSAWNRRRAESANAASAKARRASPRTREPRSGGSPCLPRGEGV